MPARPHIQKPLPPAGPASPGIAKCNGCFKPTRSAVVQHSSKIVYKLAPVMWLRGRNPATYPWGPVFVAQEFTGVDARGSRGSRLGNGGLGDTGRGRSRAQRDGPYGVVQPPA